MPIIPNSFTNIFGGTTVQPSFPSYTSFSLPPDITLSWPVTGFQTDYVAANLIDISSSEVDSTITMPPANQVSVGATVIFRNIGEFDISILDNTGGEIAVIPAEGDGTANAARIWVTDNSTIAGVWGLIYEGAVNAAPSATALAGSGLIALAGKLNTNMPITTLIANAYVSTIADRAKFFVYQGGLGTFTLPAANIVGDGFYLAIANRSVDGQLTILPQAPALIDGDSSLVMAIDQDCFIATNGVNWFTLGLGTLTFFLTNVLRTIINNDATITLTPLQATKEIQIFTGVQNQDTLVTFPNINGTYFIANNTNASDFVINITCSGSAIETAIPNGATLIFYSDGVDIRPAPTTITDIIFQDGTAADPSIQFVHSSGDGYYLPAVNRLGVAIAGSQVLEFNARGLLIDPNGTVANPSLKWSGANGGWYYNLASTDLRLAIASTDQLGVGNNQILVPDGTNVSPGLSFLDDFEKGFFGSTVDQIGMTIGGTETARVTANGLSVLGGSAGVPSLSFIGFPTYGLNLTGGNTIGVSIAGANRLTVSSVAILAIPSLVASAGIVLRTANTAQFNNTANSFSVSLKADGALAANATYTLPTAVPTINGQPVISTTGGALSFATSQFTANSIIIPNGADFIEIQAPATPASNYTYVWPADAPSPGDALRVATVVGALVTLEWAI